MVLSILFGGEKSNYLEDEIGRIDFFTLKMGAEYGTGFLAKKLPKVIFGSVLCLKSADVKKVCKA